MHPKSILLYYYAVVSSIVLLTSSSCSSFTLTMMGKRKGNLKNQLLLNDKQQELLKKNATPRSMNRGRGQLLSGVSFPEEMKVKGWEFGNDQRMACARVNGRLYAVEGACPRCAFDLYRGTLVFEEAFGDDPVLACPTCSTTYNLRTGAYGPPLKRTGLSSFVGKLAQTATKNEAKDATCFVLTTDEEGKVYCRPR